MDFWNDMLTDKSWKILQRIKEYDFVLIGGWAAFLWTNLHKSKDIDIIMRRIEDLEIIRKNFDLRKNPNLRKYEIKIEEIDIDIYVPYYSQIAIPIEDLVMHTTKIQGFRVVKPEALLILKQGAEEDREHSVKGQKDRIDIMTLLSYTDVNIMQYLQLLEKYKLKHYESRLRMIVREFADAKYLDMTPRELKLKKKAILESLR